MGAMDCSQSPLERGARDGESPVDDAVELLLVEFLSNARLE